MEWQGLPDFDGHEHLVFVHDRATGLRAISAVHRWRAGTAGGGIRMQPYPDTRAAVTDVLRLSRGMSYKWALAGQPLGGAKHVIIGDPVRDKTDELLLAFARALDRFGGRLLGGPDVGISVADLAVMRQETTSLRGDGGASGDTGPATARGVFHGIRAAVAHALGRDDLAGLTVAVQGAGSVGRYLCRDLTGAGARILVADVNSAAAAAVAAESGAVVVAPDEIIGAEADVLAPCALGGVLDDTTIPTIRARIVCGGANNQLAEARHGVALAARGILYAPDFVVNAGGAVKAINEGPDMDEARIMEGLVAIGETCRRIFALAEADGVATSEAADRLAREIVDGQANPPTPALPRKGGGGRNSGPGRQRGGES